MNELVQIVQQKSGLSEEQSTEIVRAIVGYVKGKLPEALASHVDSLVGDLGTSGTEAAAAPESGAASLLSSVVGGLFGGKKEA
ncbi:MAG TPA: hypothetical protein VM554_13715 [Acidisarcina sp.]|nr:hypothetical protein [Acidisarcina sp.]